MKVCQHCGGQIITNWGVAQCFQCRRTPKAPVPVFTEKELTQERRYRRRASHYILHRADYSKDTQ